MLHTPVRALTLAGLSLALLSSPAALQAAGKTRGEKYALLVGVKSYDPAELRSLPFTENDVRNLAEVLRLGGYQSENIRLMTHSAAADNPRLTPTGKNIRTELDRLVKDLSEDDSVLVAFAGHGVKFKEGEESYFCPMDASLKDRDTLLSLDEVYRQLGQCKAAFRLMLVDACRDDPFATIDRAPKGEFESVTRPQKRPVPGGVAVLFSCSSGEKAYEDKDRKHGVFFYYVIQALAGEAAKGDDEDEITLPQLEHFVKKRVSDFVWNKYSVRQMPELKTGISIGLSPLVRLSNRRGEALFRGGLASYNKKSYKAARTEFTKAIEANPKYEAAYIKRGHARFQLEDYDGAIADYRTALELNPESAEAYLGIGDVRFYGQEDLKKAITSYGKAIQLKPKHAAYYNRRGVAYYENDNLEEALADFNQAIELNELYAEAFYNRAYLWKYKKSWKKAFADSHQAVQLDPYENRYRKLRAYIKEKREDVKGALADYGKAIRVDPQDEGAYYHRGNTYLRQEDYEAAVQNYSKVVGLNANNSDAYYWRGYAYHCWGYYDYAVADYDRCLRINPNHSQAKTFRGHASQRIAGGARGRDGGGHFGGRMIGGGLGGGGRGIGGGGGRGR